MRFAIVMIAAAVMAVAGAGTIASLDGARHPKAAPQVATAVEPSPYATAGEADIAKSPDGHYWAQADVDGHDVRFLVDTGATAVALTADDARRLGIEPNSLNYSYTIMTANGPSRAAAVKLSAISVGGARVEGVDAFVIDHGLETSLLGMTFLGRLSKFEATQSNLILRS